MKHRHRALTRAIARIIYHHVFAGGPDIGDGRAVPHAHAEGVLFGVERAAESITKKLRRQAWLSRCRRRRRNTTRATRPKRAAR
jgi:hypothetical protein